MARYDLETTTLGDLLDDPEAVAVIERVLPRISSHPMAALVRGMQVSAALSAAAGRISDTQRAQLMEELGSLQ